MSHANYHLRPTARAKTLAVASQQKRSAARIHIAKTSVPAALYHARNRHKSNINYSNITIHMIINITHQTDAQHVACQTFALILHITTLLVATIISRQGTQHGMDTCTPLM